MVCLKVYHCWTAVPANGHKSKVCLDCSANVRHLLKDQIALHGIRAMHAAQAVLSITIEFYTSKADNQSLSLEPRT